MIEAIPYLIDKRKDKTTIQFIIRLKGQRLRFVPGISVETKHWIDSKRWCRENKQYPDGYLNNLQIKKYKQLIEDILNEFQEKLINPTQETFKKAIQNKIDELNLTEGGTISESKQKEIDEYEKSQRFIDYAELFKSKSTKSKSTINTYSTAIKHLMEYQSKLNENSKTPISIKFADIDMNFYNSFRQYLLDKDLSKNHIGGIIKNVIVFMNGAKEDNLYKWEKPKGFIVEKEDADTIALTIEEINKVYNLIFTEELIKEFYPDIYQNNLRSMIKSLTTERDRFLIGYCTALRISDYSRINDYNIEDGLISIWTKKKDKKVYLPMHRYLRDIIERNKGLKLPKISDQKHNDALKEIFKIAKVNNPIKTTITKGGKRIEDIKPKYELVTSHTARRSGATNMYRNGIDLLYISRLLGHSKIEQTVKYLKITTKELANRMKNNPYFTGE